MWRSSARIRSSEEHHTTEAPRESRWPSSGESGAIPPPQAGAARRANLAPSPERGAAFWANPPPSRVGTFPVRRIPPYPAKATLTVSRIRRRRRATRTVWRIPTSPEAPFGESPTIARRPSPFKRSWRIQKGRPPPLRDGTPDRTRRPDRRHRMRGCDPHRPAGGEHSRQGSIGDGVGVLINRFPQDYALARARHVRCPGESEHDIA